MSVYYTEQELIAAVPGLSRTLLVRFVEAEIVLPVQGERITEPVYRPLDAARLRLACELSDCYDLEDDALSMVLRLVDQLHGVRAELRALMHAVETQPAEARKRIGAVLAETRRG